MEDFWKNQWKLKTHFPNGDVLNPEWESCFFYESNESQVVARYASEEEAIEGHLTLVRKMLLLDHSKGEEDAKFHSEGTPLEPQVPGAGGQEQEGL